MKKTLFLLATLLAPLAAQAETIWTAGVIEGAPSTYYTAYKHNPSYGWDHNMCWAVSASNVIAWWQDQVTQSGAYILPEDCPTGLGVWEQVRLLWQDNAGYAVRVMQHWLSGDRSGSNDSKFTQEGLEFKGYFNHLLGADYSFNGDPRPANCMTATVYANAKTSKNTYDSAVPQIIDLISNGWGLVLGTTNHAMTMYAIEVDEQNEITQVWYSDNNYPSYGDGYLKTASVHKGAENQFGYNGIIANAIGYGGAIENVYAMRSTGMQFDTYEAVAGADNTADVFSHFLNLTVDGASDYRLKYDLRVAGEDCPVDTQGNEVGNIRLLDGKLSLVAGVDKYDGGGSAQGTISFGENAADDGSRTLSVQHSACIAGEIRINTADGNTLEVTEGNTASFGRLTGTGNLDKTGAGTAEVTELVCLQGTINVHAGQFLLGTDVVLGAETVLTVDSGAQVGRAAGQPVTLTLDSGIHTNDGMMTLTTTVNANATLKGSGTFGVVTVDGGKLVVGNSPGHQEYTGALTLNSGSIEFAVGGVQAASTGQETGWQSGTYSTINMGGHDLVIGPDGEILIAVGEKALTSMGGAFELALVTGLNRTFSDAELAKLAEQTSFVPAEVGAAETSGMALTTPNFSYKMSGNTLVLTSASAAGDTVPEPATGTLSLLALASLCTRRRRK